MKTLMLLSFFFLSVANVSANPQNVRAALDKLNRAELLIKRAKQDLQASGSLECSIRANSKVFTGRGQNEETAYLRAEEKCLNEEKNRGGYMANFICVKESLRLGCE